MNNQESLVEDIKKLKSFEAPEWAGYVKTGVSKERAPTQEDWWQRRVLSILGKVLKFGPIGTNKLAKQYGGKKNRGHKPDKKYIGSRNIIRKVLQQLENEGFVEKVKKPVFGRVVTKKGKEFLGNKK